MRFAPLHLHTEYSLLDGFCRISELAPYAAEMGLPAVAMTDHGNLHGAIDFYRACKKASVKPILGCEVYWANGSAGDKSAKTAREASTHMTLLASNNTGWKNLCRLVSAANMHGFHYKPRVDEQMMEEFAEGIICLTGCMSSRFSRHIREGNKEKAFDTLNFLIRCFGKENVYVELQNHGIEDQERILRCAVEIAKQMGIPTVASNDTHYLRREDAPLHEALLALQTGKTLADTKRMRLTAPEFYLKSEAEMIQAMLGNEDAVYRTVEVADRCDVSIEFGVLHYPKFDAPNGAFDHIRSVAEKRLADLDGGDVERERLRYELEVVGKSGFADYFGVVADIRRFAIENGIPTGPGRGSAVGSYLSYLLKIIDINPLEYTLFFERFLNPDRVSPPDIDMDFCPLRRGEVISYIRQRYGADSVAQIATFSTLGARTAIRDACRAYGLSVPQGNKMAEMFPEGSDRSAFDAYDGAAALPSDLKAVPNAAEAFMLARSICGLPRHVGVHAGGVVVSPEPIASCIPILKSKSGDPVTQWEYQTVADLGFLKLDILGVAAVTTVANCVRLVKDANPSFDPDTIPLDDKRTAEIYSSGNAFSIFQIESPMIRDFVRDMPVQNVRDFAVATAICRPGPVEMAPEFLKRRHGKMSPKPVHPSCQKATEDTGGIMVYQEQVMEVVTILAGFTLAQADNFRRAMSKKDQEMMASERAKFVAGCAEKSQIPADKANEIFDLLEKFTGYGFNKSHAVAYAFVSWKMAYFKAHYPAQFFAAAMTSETGNTEKIGRIILDARRNGVRCRLPDINRAMPDFSIDKGDVIFGLNAIKGVSAEGMSRLVAEREAHGPFQMLQESLSRLRSAGVKDKDLKLLAMAGAMDQFGDRNMLVTTIDAKVDRSNTLSLFSNEEIIQFTPAKTDDLCVNEQLLLGCALTRRESVGPLGLRPWLRAMPIRKLLASKEAKGVSIAGCVHVAEKRKGKGRDYVFMTVRDETGSIDCICADKATVLKPGASVVVRGDYKKGELRVKTMEPLRPYKTVGWFLLVDSSWNADSQTQLATMCRGTMPLRVCGPTGTPFTEETFLVNMDLDTAELLFEIPGVEDIKADVCLEAA